MEFDVTFSADEGFVRIKLNESITADLGRKFSEEAIAIAKRNGVSRYFADVRGVANVAEVLEQYRLAYEEMKSLGLDSSSRIAVCVTEGDSSHDFIETVFSNAGYSFRLFVDEEDALRWLME